MPSPSDFLGHVAGAAGELTRSARIHAYYRALAAASPRVRVETIGRTEEGRDILLAVIADEAGIRDLPRLKAATAALADPRRTDPAQAETLIAGARPFYYFNGALHADETGSAEMLMELAYRLAVSDDPRIRRIRENVVVLINPVAEPDGRDKMADWFYRYLKGRTDYAAPAAPVAALLEPLRVRGHQPRRAPARVRGHPRRAPDVLRLPPAGHPRPARGHPAAADLERHRALQPEPRPDRAVRVPRHEPARGDDAHRAGHAGGVDVGLRRGVRPSLPGLDRDEPQRDRPRLRDLRQRHRGDGGPRGGGGRHQPRVVPARAGRRPASAGRCATTSTTSRRRRWPSSTTSPERPKEYLRRFHRTGWNSWRKGRRGASRSPSSSPPARATGGGWPSSSTCCARSASRSAPLRGALEVAEGRFAAGSYVVRLDQPYRNYAVDLLTPQAFPSDAQHLPYDDVSWSLPLHFGVQRRARGRRAGAGRRAHPGHRGRDRRRPRRGRGPGLPARRPRPGSAARRAPSARRRFRIEIAEEAFTAGGASLRRPDPGSSPRRTGSRTRCATSRPSSASTSRARPPRPPSAATTRRWPASASSSPGRTPTPSAGSATSSTASAFPTSTCATRTCARATSGSKVDVIVYGHVRLDLAAQIHGIEPVAGRWPSRPRAD